MNFYESPNGSADSGDGCLAFLLVPLAFAILSALLETFGDLLERRERKKQRAGNPAPPEAEP